MNPVCQLVAHRVISHSPANQGFHFSKCCRCHTDLMRSARRDFSNWRAVPDGLRVCWGDFDPNQPPPPWYIVTLARHVAERISAAVSASMVLGYVAAGVLLEKGAALPGRIVRGLSRSGRRIDQDSPRRPKRFSVIVLLQRNMLHFEFKLARS